MSPVHTDKVDGTAGAVASQEPEAGGEKRDEFGLVHLPGRHLKFTMVDGAITADVPVDRDVIGRINKHDSGPAAAHQGRIRLRLDRACRTERDACLNATDLPIG